MPSTTPAYYTDRFVLPLPSGHRFPMAKYRRIRERLAVSPLASRLSFSLPSAATDEELTAVHDPDYVRRVTRGELTDREQARLGLPWSAELSERARRSVGATLAATRLALDTGLGITLAGGTHHARAEAGHGYCVYNDAAVALSVLRREGRIRRAAVLDLDVHQGNGTALILADRHELRTISVNEAPLAGRYAHPSDLDLDLPHGTGDAAYLAAVTRALDEVSQPPLPEVVIYIAGVDPFEGDLLGQLGVTRAGLLQRDRLVFERCRSRDLPVVVTMGGGYQADADQVAALHAATVEAAVELLANAA